jgi:signal transduction histidine kinase
VSNASLILSKEAERDPQRAPASRLLARSVASLRTLLSELIDLARLEAGQERRNIARFDAAEVLREFCENLRPLATRHNLFLRCDGPASLPVEGDSVKMLRIAQNLVLNAFSVTAEGGVQVLWEARDGPQAGQWLLSVQDTGPGFQRHSEATPLEGALREATAEAHDVTPGIRPAPTLKSQTSAGSSPGASHEGIGLSIVKRLCELLDASLELETTPGTGTTFRVVFPRSYPAAGPPP